MQVAQAAAAAPLEVEVAAAEVRAKHDAPQSERSAAASTASGTTRIKRKRRVAKSSPVDETSGRAVGVTTSAISCDQTESNVAEHADEHGAAAPCSCAECGAITSMLFRDSDAQFYCAKCWKAYYDALDKQA